MIFGIYFLEENKKFKDDFASCPNEKVITFMFR